MTKNKDFKDVVRARAAKTGESYAAARSRLVASGDRDPTVEGLGFARDEIVTGPIRGWWGEFRPRLNGLTDTEYLWEPVPGCPTIRRVGGGFQADPLADDSSVRTIGWELAGMTSLLRMRANAHFGDRQLTWLDIEVGATAARGVELLEEAFDGWADAVARVDPEALTRPSEGPPRMIDGQFPFLQVVLHTIQLLLPTAGRIVLLRGLFAAREGSAPTAPAITT